MKRLLLGALLLFASAVGAQAQQSPILLSVVAACGNQTYTVGTNRPGTQDATGTGCVAGGGGGGGNVTIVAPLGSKVSAQSVSTVIASDQGAIPVTSGVAQASSTSGQTVSPIGGRSLNAPATDTTGQTNIPWMALSGALVVYPYSNPENLVSGVTAAMTGTTTTSLIAAPGSGRNYITNIVCTNSHATVGTFVLIQDGSGGTTIYEAYAAAVGGGFSINFPAPLRQPTATTALFVADVTTGANVICAASGFKAP